MTPGGARAWRIGIFGGSFDPPHVAHLLCAARAAVAADLDEVIFVVAGNPYQKEAAATAEERFRMVELAVGGRPGVSASRIEVDRAGASFTIDTIRAIGRDRPDADLWFIAGSDTVAGVRSWHEWSELVASVGWVVIPRSGVTTDAAVDALGEKARVIVVSGPSMLDLSSTEVRARVAEGLPVAHLVQSDVADFIENAGLYRD